MTEHIDELAAAVAARVIEALPRGRLPITPKYLSADQVAQMTGFSRSGWKPAGPTAPAPPTSRSGTMSVTAPLMCAPSWKRAR